MTLFHLIGYCIPLYTTLYHAANYIPQVPFCQGKYRRKNGYFSGLKKVLFFISLEIFLTPVEKRVWMARKRRVRHARKKRKTHYRYCAGMVPAQYLVPCRHTTSWEGKGKERKCERERKKKNKKKERKRKTTSSPKRGHPSWTRVWKSCSVSRAIEVPSFPAWLRPGNWEASPNTVS